MSKIEEKAKDYAERNYSPSFPFDALKLAYIKGATEQRDIDIERAWQWMRNHIKLIGSEMELRSQFVKAMNDEKYL